MDNQKNTAWNMTAMTDGTILVNTQDGEVFEIGNTLSPDDALGEIEWVLEQSCICNECREEEAKRMQNESHEIAILTKVDDEDRAPLGMDDPGKSGFTESGIMKLLLLARTQTMDGFFNWIFRTLLPALRRDGKYEISDIPTDDIAKYFFFAVDYLHPVSNKQTQLDLPLKAESN